MASMAGRGAFDMVKSSAVIKLKGFLLAWVLRLLCLTWRVCFQGREHMDWLYNTESCFLLCFWHGKYVPIFPLLEGYKACVISSQSDRGSIIAEICRNFGYQSAQIPDQASRDSFRLMKEILSQARAGGTAADGPLGPYHQVKYSLIQVASALGFDLLPVSVGSSRKIILNKRWDRMELPLPFTKVCMVFGKPIKVPPNLRSGQIRQLAGHLAKAITDLDDKAQKIALGNGG